MISPTTTREDLLTAATDLLQRLGYSSFSYRDLAEAVGIRAASIHYHFPGKEDLGLALVERYRTLTRERERDLTASFPEVRARLDALFTAIAEHTCTEGKSCPINSLQAEYAVLPAALQRAVKELVDEKLAILTRWLDEGRKAGQLRFPGTPATQALLVWSVIEYGTQHSRSHPGRSFATLARQLLATMSP